MLFRKIKEIISITFICPTNYIVGSLTNFVMVKLRKKVNSIKK